MDENRQQRIVVGVRGSGDARAALTWAAREAGLRGASLLVVRAWDSARHAAPYAPADATPTGDVSKVMAGDDLADAVLAAFGLKAPAYVSTELAEGIPERVLVDRSVGADLLVLGTTRIGSAAEMSAGPVVRSCLAHSQCPVVIVSAGGAAAPAEPTPTAAVA
jgi:nucleotide-binding universal stress UspA family protein